MAGSKRHILVVDDNEYNREILMQNLEDLGFEAKEAPDGKAALTMIREEPPSLVLLDVMMPGIDGIEVARQVREEMAIRDLPIIMVTARADSRDIVSGLKAGANDYVTKPVDIDVLMARIETHLRLRDLSEQVREQNELMIRELAAARAVQESLLPQRDRLDKLPGSYGLRVAALWQPCATLCGDFWDVISLADGSLGMMLIDFAGTGVVPSLNTFRIKTFLQGQCAGLYNAELTMARLNSFLVEILPTGESANCHYARYDIDTRSFHVVAGGSPAPLIYRAGDGSVQRLNATGKPAGASADTAYKEKVITLETGDKIVFFSNGLSKAGETTGSLYSDVRLAEVLAGNGDREPDEVANALRSDIERVTGEAELHDDVTVLIAEVVG